MRFLQTEWHRHERDRNAWEIERAEMKSRIGKIEGDGRTAKRLQETLGKHVKILENALRRERELVKKLRVSAVDTENPIEASSEKDYVKDQAKGRPGSFPCDGQLLKRISFHVSTTEATSRRRRGRFSSQRDETRP